MRGFIQEMKKTLIKRGVNMTGMILMLALCLSLMISAAFRNAKECQDGDKH